MNKTLEKEVQTLRSQGVPEEAIIAYIQMKSMGQQQQTPMSRQDAVTIQSREGNVPGTYIDAYQMQQENYGQMRQQMEEQARLQAVQAELSPQAPRLNPNARVETEGQNVTVGPNGQIIYY